MCHWLTIAVPDRAALVPLRTIGTDHEPADFPQLPERHRDLQRFLVTRGGCACDLFAARGHDSLIEALTQARRDAGVLLAHRTFGDPPRGAQLHAAERRSPREFVTARDALDDRWVTLDVSRD